MTGSISVMALAILFGAGLSIGCSMAFVRAFQRALAAHEEVPVEATLMGIAVVLGIVGTMMFAWAIVTVTSNPVWSRFIDVMVVIVTNVVMGLVAYSGLNGGITTPVTQGHA